MSKETKFKKKQVLKYMKECKKAIKEERSKLFDLTDKLCAINNDCEEAENYLDRAIEEID